MYVLTKDYRVISAWELGGLEYIKYASTLEELCDEFVCESNEEWNDFYKIYQDKWELLGDVYWNKYSEHYNFYAGVMIKNKGLIYVAKLNDKGELERL